MGVDLSISQTHTDSESDQTKSVMLFQFCETELVPISCLDFVCSPSSFTTFPLILVDRSTGVPPTNEIYGNAPESLTQFYHALHKSFSLYPFVQGGHSCWSIIRQGGSPTDALRARGFAQTADIRYVSTSAVRASSVFSDMGAFVSVLAVCRAPTAPTGASLGARMGLRLHSQSVNARPFTIETRAAIGKQKKPTLALIGNECDEIIPSVYVGSERAAADESGLRARKITHIVTLSMHSPVMFPGKFTYHVVNVKDDVFETLNKEFYEAILFIRAALGEDGIVLIHCKKGESRSPALCVAFLMKHRNMTFRAALSLVVSKRPSVQINQGFMDQLKEMPDI